MNVIHLNGNIFDLEQVVSQDIQVNCVRLQFRNGDEMAVYWRDDQERREVLSVIADSRLKLPGL